MFLLVRTYNALEREQEKQAAVEPAAEIVLLSETRELLDARERV